MSKVLYVELLAEQAASYMCDNLLVARYRKWRVVNIWLAVEEAVISAHDASLNDPATLALLTQGLDALGVDLRLLERTAWTSHIFCNGMDAHGPRAGILWTQIAGSVHHHLENDDAYRDLRRLSRYRGVMSERIIAEHDAQFSPP